MSEETRKYCCGCSLVVLFITSVILFAVSFDTLNPHQVGIKYNNNLKTIDKDRVYNNGRYFLGLGLSFIEFPVSAELIEFRGSGALRMWTKEGQLVVVDLSLMYRLQRQHVHKIYFMFLTDYHSRLEQIAIRVSKKVSIQYTAEDFFQRRNLVGAHIRSELRRRLSDFYVTLELFNLRKIDIPTKFENKVIEKQITEQIKQTRIFERITATKRANITILQEVANATVGLKIAKAEAQRRKEVEKAKADAIRDLSYQESVSYSLVQRDLGISGESILQFRYSQLMEKLQEGDEERKLKYFIGLQQKMLTIDNF